MLGHNGCFSLVLRATDCCLSIGEEACLHSNAKLSCCLQSTEPKYSWSCKGPCKSGYRPILIYISGGSPANHQLMPMPMATKGIHCISPRGRRVNNAYA